MPKLKLRSSQWIVDEHNNIIIGNGRAEILKNIEQTGSINQTAKVMKMSYKAVWSKIKATEKHLDTRIVHTDRKEGSRLSREGKELLQKYRRLKEKCMSVDDKIFNQFFGK
jgi:molybdate transport system regulatory protein